MRSGGNVAEHWTMVGAYPAPLALHLFLDHTNRRAVLAGYERSGQALIGHCQGKSPEFRLQGLPARL